MGKSFPLATTAVLTALAVPYFTNDKYYKQSIFYKNNNSTDKIITNRVHEPTKFDKKDIVDKSYESNKTYIFSAGSSETLRDSWNYNLRSLVNFLQGKL
ncbi:hypothetical protein QEN19_003102 [Hanseniaspora menglaensis]